MTDRYYALTVVLEKNLREDDAEPIIAAIQLLRGVRSVTAHVGDVEIHAAMVRAKGELTEKLFEVLK